MSRIYWPAQITRGIVFAVLFGLFVERTQEPLLPQADRNRLRDAARQGVVGPTRLRVAVERGLKSRVIRKPPRQPDCGSRPGLHGALRRRVNSWWVSADTSGRRRVKRGGWPWADRLAGW